MLRLGFDRLIKEVDELVRDQLLAEEVFIQTGFASYEPKHCRYQKVVPFEELQRLMRACRVLVTHGGAGLIADGLELGKPVVAVPRRKKHGEHVNDHQLELTGALEKEGRIVVVHEVSELLEALERVTHLSARPVSEDRKVIGIVDDFLRQLAGAVEGEHR